MITYRKATIVVCSTVDAEKVDHLLDLFPSNYNVSVGISNSFHRIELLRDALSEARDALSIGKSIEPGRRVFPFEELGISIMLRHFSEKEDISRYIHPALHWLKQYDDEYNTKLLPTVREYIQQNGSIKKTAEALLSSISASMIPTPSLHCACHSAFSKCWAESEQRSSVEEN